MKKYFAIVFAFFALVHAHRTPAESFQYVLEGPLHEAYAVQESGTLISEAVPNAPPPLLSEMQSFQTDPESVWIPGYWAWSRTHGIYLWVSGIWRRPPPGHTWIAGYWKNYFDSWVWIRGFWSKKSRDDLAYLVHPPPDPIDERSGSPPSHTEDYYWVPGLWEFDGSKSKYIWYSGRWDLFDPNWVYTPAQYLWREKGYVFVPGFWDWPLDTRGVVFASVYVNPDVIETAVYEPQNALQHLVVMELLYPCWPNYASLFQFHYHTFKQAWASWGAAPPWWVWPSWWSFTWQDLWGLWWWWSHPGYPNPSWVDPTIASLIDPPPTFIVKMMGTVRPPANVTARGVVGNTKLLQGISSFSGRNIPILPSDPKQIIQIQELAKPKTQQTPKLEPRGKGKVVQPPPKPFFGPQKESLPVPPQRVVLPPRPSVSQTNGKKNTPPLAPKHYRQPVYQPTAYMPPPQKKLPEPYFPTPPAPRTPLPSYTPQPRIQNQYYYTKPPERAIPQPSVPQQNLPTYWQWRYHPGPNVEATPPFNPPYMQPDLPYQFPTQGYHVPFFKRPLHPPQTEIHDFYMTRPMPQINPEGPKAHQVPGDYSTLPNQ